MRLTDSPSTPPDAVRHVPAYVHGHAGLVALVLYAAFLAYQSLAAGGEWACNSPMLAIPARVSRTDALANVLAYLPFGLLFVMTTARAGASGWAQLRRASAGVALIAAFSVALEITQACQADRVSSAYDCASNTIGGALGVALGLALVSLRSRRSPRIGDSARDRRLQVVTLMVVGGWVVSQTSPWIFSADVGTVAATTRSLRYRTTWALDAWPLIRHLAAWVALACACRLASRRRWSAVGVWCAAALASTLLQLTLEAPNPLPLEELAGMAAASIALLVGLVRGKPHTRAWAFGLLVSAMVSMAAFELEPGPGQLGTLPFSLVPMVGLGSTQGAIDYALLFGWFGLCVVAAARWSECAGGGLAHRWWPAAAVLVTLGFEVAQTRIPGRGPDVSAPIFTLLAALGASVLLKDDDRRGELG